MAVASEAGLERGGSRRNSRRCCLPNDKGLKEKIIFVIFKKKVLGHLKILMGENWLHSLHTANDFQMDCKYECQIMLFG